MYFWFTIATLHPTLPTQKSPLIFYSNQLHNDLKQVTLHALNKAQKSITLQIYGLTDPDVISLLEKKVQQGLEVKIFYDKGASKALPKHLPSYPVQNGGLMHRKILIIDEALTLLGSANLTTQSLKMHDNLIIGIWDPHLASFFNDSTQDYSHFFIDNAQIAAHLLPSQEECAVDRLVEWINSAQEEIKVAMFTLTHPLLVDALCKASKRGVSVHLAIDGYTAKGASKGAVLRLLEAGATVFLSTGSELLHHKWALIDRRQVVLGSANWTLSAFAKNLDCLLMIEGLKPKHIKLLNKVFRAIAITSEKG